jgi:excisionase family DNA binding protein
MTPPRGTLSVADAMGRLRTPREVADMLRVSPSMVRALTRRGDLAAVYIGRLPRYHEGDVAAYLEHQRSRGIGR